MSNAAVPASMYGMRPLCFLACIVFVPHLFCSSAISADAPLLFNDPKPQRYELSARASELDPRARPHPEVDFVLEKDGKPLSFNITVDNDPVRNQAAVIAQQYYKKIGMDAKLEVMEWGTLVSKRYFANDYDALSIYQVYAPDPDQPAMFLSTSSGNRWNYKNLEVDQLLAAGRKESDKAKRQQTYYRFQEILASDDPPMVLLYYPKEIRAYNRALKGLPAKLDYLTSWRYVEEWWLDR